jgi:hypothetical protein
MEQYVILRETKGEYPFIAFFVGNDNQLNARLGKDVIAGDIVCEISSKRFVRFTTQPLVLKELPEDVIQ